MALRSVFINNSITLKAHFGNGFTSPSTIVKATILNRFTSHYKIVKATIVKGKKATI